VVEGSKGEAVINLNSTVGREIGSFSLYINYNPAVLNITASDISLAGTPFAQWDIGSIPVKVSNGRMEIVGFCFSSCTNYSGGATPMARIGFTAIGSTGEISSLAFTNVANQINTVSAVNPVENLLQESGGYRTGASGWVVPFRGCGPD